MRLPGSRRAGALALTLIPLAVAAACTDGEPAGQAPTVEVSRPPAAQDKIEACDVLSRQVARDVLGRLADIPTSNTTGAATQDLAVSSCSYAARRGGPRDRDVLGLVVRTGLTSAGERSNEQAFTAQRLPQGARPSSAYGDKAFWDPAGGQLSILSSGDWYILTFGSVRPDQRDYAETRDVAGRLAGLPGSFTHSG